MLCSERYRNNAETFTLKPYPAIMIITGIGSKVIFYVAIIIFFVCVLSACCMQPGWCTLSSVTNQFMYKPTTKYIAGRSQEIWCSSSWCTTAKTAVHCPQQLQKIHVTSIEVHLSHGVQISVRGLFLPGINNLMSFFYFVHITSCRIYIPCANVPAPVSLYALLKNLGLVLYSWKEMFGT